jgi:D-alanyl-D-alanine carboxypeptidase/D-alanyl-D-alanine-endopeptidase (penicillin-binding protein 4)
VQQWPVAFALVDEYAPRVFEALWREAGGQLDGRVRWGRTPGGAQSLLRMPSLPLAEIVADVNKFSNNPMAQQVFLSLSAKPGEPARSEASRQRLLAWWQQRLPQASAPTLDNGSGLSRSQRISARSLAALLQAMHQSPQAQVFRDSLAVAGVDGTMQRLRDRLPGSPLIGRAWLKTGSLRDVASIAGYVRGSSGRHYVLVALIEHEAANRARPALDALLEATAQDEAPARRTARQ